MANMNLGHTENKNPVNLDEWVKQYMSDSQADVNELKEKVNKMWSTIYPVGSIYISMNGTNPGEIWGGTWVSWGSGRVPVGINAGDPDFNTVGKTGGEKKHTLTIAEMPAHSHGLVTHSQNTTNKTTYIKSAVNSGESYPSTGDTGGGQAHNIMQPYITCYMWHRTA